VTPERLDLLLVGAVTVGAVVLFASGRLRIDLVALCILAVLGLTGLVTPGEAISGFANEATITVLAMLILAGGLTRTGATAALGRLIGRVAAGRPWQVLASLTVTAAVLSAFVNNTAVVAVLLPLAVKLGHDRGIPVSRLLIPLSFASMAGGTVTLIGTSTNLLVSALAARQGLAPITMFELSPAGLVFAAVTVAYLLVAGRWLLPGRAARQYTERYRLRDYLTELVVGRNSDLVGRRLTDIDLEKNFDVEVLGVIRDGVRTGRGLDIEVRAGDVLLVRGTVQPLLEVKELPGLSLKPEVMLGDEDLTSEDVVLAEAVLSPTSRLRGRTPRAVFFRQRFNLTILAVQRQGRSLATRLADTPLHVGDTLLLQGRRAHLEELAQDSGFIVLGEVDAPPPRRRRMWVAVAVMAAVVALAAIGVVPIVLASVAGVAAMVLLGCLTMEEAYESVEWSVIVLLAGVIPLGIALERTGAARLVAEATLAAVGWLGPVTVLSTFYLLASLLTELMSNNATAILLTPIAIAIAAQLDVDPRPFVVAVAFAASASFMTPLGYQTNALVYGPGGYRYTDYLRVGTPLNVMLWGLATLLIPVLWPLR
jgi:di/tricarboxylate transporter